MPLRHWIGFAFAFFLAAMLPDASRAAEAPAYDQLQLPPLMLASAAEQTTIIVTLSVPAGRKAEAQELQARFMQSFEEQIRTIASRSIAPDIWHIKVALMTAAEKVSAPGLIHDMRIDLVQGRT